MSCFESDAAKNPARERSNKDSRTERELSLHAGSKRQADGDLECAWNPRALFRPDRFWFSARFAAGSSFCDGFVSGALFFRVFGVGGRSVGLDAVMQMAETRSALCPQVRVYAGLAELSSC